jgi:hypothetical protein
VQLAVQLAATHEAPQTFNDVRNPFYCDRCAKSPLSGRAAAEGLSLRRRLTHALHEITSLFVYLPAQRGLLANTGKVSREKAEGRRFNAAVMIPNYAY